MKAKYLLILLQMREVCVKSGILAGELKHFHFSFYKSLHLDIMYFTLVQGVLYLGERAWAKSN